jgi:FkbM family methyltransferase
LSDERPHAKIFSVPDATLENARGGATWVLRVAVVAVAIAAAGSAAFAFMLRPRMAKPAVWSAVACPPEADPFESLLKCGSKLYSQYDEELIIRHFFRDRRGGVFLDVGAAHYKYNSTTYYLEHHLGWSGVAVDALAEYGPDYKTYRPATRFYSYIVTDHSGASEPFFVLRNKHLMSTTSPEWADTFGRDDYETVRVQTTTLNDLLSKAGLAKVDFLSMDIETGEPAALAGFDVERYRPELVCIEVTEGVRPQVTAYFEAHAYERIARYDGYDQVNWYFRPKAPAPDRAPARP